jgi:hypothetical protein
MIAKANNKYLAIPGTSTTNAATTTGNIDTLNYDFMSLDVVMTTSNDATNNPSVLKLSESDDTVVTNFADISGFVGDTDFTIPSSPTAATSNIGPFATFNVDLRGRKRYIKVTVSPVTTQVITALAQLSAGPMAYNAATSNADVVVNG